MSWFRRRPRLKEPNKMVPYRSSPIAETMMDEAKARGPSKDKTKENQISRDISKKD